MSELNKKEILLRLIAPPKKIKGPFWAREYKMLNKLMEKFPNKEFWQKIHFNTDWDSLMAFTTGYGLSLLETKYKEFFYKIPEQPKIELTKKIGSDRIVNRKPKTIRGFLS